MSTAYVNRHQKSIFFKKLLPRSRSVRSRSKNLSSSDRATIDLVELSPMPLSSGRRSSLSNRRGEVAIVVSSSCHSRADVVPSMCQHQPCRGPALGQATSTVSGWHRDTAPMTATRRRSGGDGTLREQTTIGGHHGFGAVAPCTP
jgi:hypothetical protein